MFFSIAQHNIGIFILAFGDQLACFAYVFQRTALQILLELTLLFFLTHISPLLFFDFVSYAIEYQRYHSSVLSFSCGNQPPRSRKGYRGNSSLAHKAPYSTPETCQRPSNDPMEGSLHQCRVGSICQHNSRLDLRSLTRGVQLLFQNAGAYKNF